MCLFKRKDVPLSGNTYLKLVCSECSAELKHSLNVFLHYSYVDMVMAVQILCLHHDSSGQIFFLGNASCWDKCSSEGLDIDPDQTPCQGGPFGIYSVLLPQQLFELWGFSLFSFCLQGFSCLSVGLCAKSEDSTPNWLLWAGFCSLPNLPISHSNQLPFFKWETHSKRQLSEVINALSGCSIYLSWLPNTMPLKQMGVLILPSVSVQSML